jgi:putative transposase
MLRKARFFLPVILVHIVQRGHSREATFFEDQDYSTYLYRLKESATKYEISTHAFVLMTNHIHFLLSPKSVVSVSRFMQITE